MPDNLQYHVLPQNDPVRALNILREAAGLEPWLGADAPSEDLTNRRPGEAEFGRRR